jgi:hypothetical protein
MDSVNFWMYFQDHWCWLLWCQNFKTALMKNPVLYSKDNMFFQCKDEVNLTYIEFNFSYCRVKVGEQLQLNTGFDMHLIHLLIYFFEGKHCCVFSFFHCVAGFFFKSRRPVLLLPAKATVSKKNSQLSSPLIYISIYQYNFSLCLNMYFLFLLHSNFSSF